MDANLVAVTEAKRVRREILPTTRQPVYASHDDQGELGRRLLNIIEALSQAALIHPKNTDVIFELGIARCLAGREHLSDLRAAWDIGDLSHEQISLALSLFDSDERITKIESALEWSTVKTSDSWYMLSFRLAKLYFDKALYRLYLGVLQKWRSRAELERVEDLVSVRWALLEAHLILGEGNEAKLILDEILGTSGVPNEASFARLTIGCRIQNNQFSDAIEQLGAIDGEEKAIWEDIIQVLSGHKVQPRNRDHISNKLHRGLLQWNDGEHSLARVSLRDYLEEPGAKLNWELQALKLLDLD